MEEFQEYDYIDRIAEIEEDFDIDLSRVEGWLEEDLDELYGLHLCVVVLYYALGIPILIGIVCGAFNLQLLYMSLCFLPIA